MADSDFYLRFTLTHDEVYDDETITAELYLTETNTLIITTGMGYQAVEDMNEWNLTMIYQLMANAPLNKYISTWAPPPQKKVYPVLSRIPAVPGAPGRVFIPEVPVTG
ncbi:hypothetical protein FACS189491_12290 [Spirochaetia bacterium]|nr:hypothetical protein FACS189491_12290 [Spirochaetia bacterium]